MRGIIIEVEMRDIRNSRMSGWEMRKIEEGSGIQFGGCVIN